jgi:hypothetical protein
MSVDLAGLSVRVDTTGLDRLTAANSNVAQSAQVAGEAFDREAARMRQYAAVAKRTGEEVEQVRRRMEALTREQSRRPGSWTGIGGGGGSGPRSGGGGGGGGGGSGGMPPPDDMNRLAEAARAYAQRIAVLELRQRGLNREAAQFMAIQRSGVAAGSESARIIGHLAGRQYDLEQQMNKTNDSTMKLANTLTRRLLMAGGAMVARQAFQWLWDLNTQLAETSKLIRTIGANGNAFQGLQSMGRMSGIQDSEFNKTMVSLTEDIGRAKMGLGEIGKLMRANNMTLGTTEETFLNVADLIQRSSGNLTTQFAILKSAGIPQTMEWINLLSKGRGELERYSKGFKGISDDSLKAAEETSARFNKIWEDFTMTAKREAVRAFDAPLEAVKKFLGEKDVQLLIKFFGWMSSGALTRGLTGTPPPAPAPRNSIMAPDLDLTGGGPGMGGTRVTPKPVRDPALEREAALKANDIARERISILGEMATAAEKLRLKELELQRQAIESGVTAGDRAKSVLELYRLELDQRAQQVRASNGIVNVNELMILKQRELNLEVQKGTMTQEEMNIAMGNYARHAQEAANQAEVYASKLPGLTRFGQEAMNISGQIDQLGTSLAGELTGGLVDVINKTKDARTAWADFGKSAIRMMSEMIIKMTIMGPLTRAIGGAFGGVSNGNTLSQAFPVPIGMPAAHSGRGPGDPWLVLHTGAGPGERNAIIRDDETVLTPGQLRAGLGAGARRAPTIKVVNMVPNTEVEGRSDPDSAEITVRGLARDEIASNRSAPMMQSRYGLSPRMRSPR